MPRLFDLGRNRVSAYNKGRTTIDVEEKNMKKIVLVVMAAMLMLSIAALPAQAKGFKDVPASHPYYQIIHQLAEVGIINGYPDQSFKPNANVTRGQVALLITRAIELPVTQAAKDFTDVPASAANYSAIQKMQQAGIFTTDAQGKLYPAQPITRAEMAKALVIAFNLTGTTDAQFTDVTTAHPYYAYINTLYANAITTGSNGAFMPTKALSRAHFAVFMHRALGEDIAKGRPTDGSYVDPNAPTGFANCMALKAYYPNGVKAGHPAYESKFDRDNDGWACVADDAVVVAPKPTPTPPPAKKYKNCTELRKDYPNGVPASHPSYEKRHDRDNDGWACER